MFRHLSLPLLARTGISQRRSYLQRRGRWRGTERGAGIGIISVFAMTCTRGEVNDQIGLLRVQLLLLVIVFLFPRRHRSPEVLVEILVRVRVVTVAVAIAMAVVESVVAVAVVVAAAAIVVYFPVFLSLCVFFPVILRGVEI